MEIKFEVSYMFDTTGQSYVADICVSLPAENNELCESLRNRKITLAGENLRFNWGILNINVRQHHVYLENSCIDNLVEEVEETINGYVSVIKIIYKNNSTAAGLIPLSRTYNYKIDEDKN